MWPAIALSARVAIIAYTAIVGLGAALKAVGVVTPVAALETWVWLVSLIVLGVENVVTLVVRRVRTQRGQKIAKLEDTLVSALIQIVQSGNALHLEEIGANVYVASRIDRLLRRPHEQTRLRRVARIRPGRYPQQSGVDWASGKGAVGECWKAKKRSYKNWHAIAEKYAHMELDEASFLKIPASTRCGFTRAEFMAICDKYSEIIAEPIWDPRKTGRILGVITIDRAYHEVADTYMPKLEKRATHETAAVAAGVVSRILKPRGTED